MLSVADRIRSARLGPGAAKFGQLVLFAYCAILATGAADLVCLPARTESCCDSYLRQAGRYIGDAGAGTCGRWPRMRKGRWNHPSFASGPWELDNGAVTKHGSGCG